MQGVWDRLQAKRLPKKISAIKSMNKAADLHSKDVTQTQQRPELPTVTCTWHASKYKVHELHWRYTQLFIMEGWSHKNIYVCNIHPTVEMAYLEKTKNTHTKNTF